MLKLWFTFTTWFYNNKYKISIYYRYIYKILCFCLYIITNKYEFSLKYIDYVAEM